MKERMRAKERKKEKACDREAVIGNRNREIKDDEVLRSREINAFEFQLEGLVMGKQSALATDSLVRSVSITFPFSLMIGHG